MGCKQWSVSRTVSGRLRPGDKIICSLHLKDRKKRNDKTQKL